jgi:hypothetical protein
MEHVENTWTSQRYPMVLLSADRWASAWQEPKFHKQLAVQFVGADLLALEVHLFESLLD